MYWPDEAPITGRLAGAALCGPGPAGGGVIGLTSSPGRGTGVGAGGLPTALSTLLDTPLAGVGVGGGGVFPPPPGAPPPLSRAPAPPVWPPLGGVYGPGGNGRGVGGGGRRRWWK